TANDDGTYTATGSDELVTTMSWVLDTTRSILGLPSSSTTTDQSSNEVSQTHWLYDSQPLGNVTKGNLTKKEDWKSGTSYVNVQHAYDGTYGLVTSDTDPRGQVTSYA